MKSLPVLRLRDCQKPMVQAMLNHKRFNIFASPGTGKTGATLYALDALQMLDGDVYPVLVVAPKRVANQVWPAEARDWANFQHIKVVRVLGDVESRRAALKVADAHIYTVNPANLSWLVAELGDSWPYRTVVVDESTTIKGHRCSLRKLKSGKTSMRVDGAKRARDLIKNAPRTHRWYNLTGTPDPNGVKDLWGQMFPIDMGRRLGASFSAFSERWFRPAYGSTPEQQRIEPLPGAEEEISERIKDRCVVVDAYDYFDISKPVEIEINVELPDKARKQYDKLHKDSVLDLAEAEVTAVNAGSLVMKCRQLASGHLRDDKGVWHHVHDAKLEALDELVDSLNGSPLLVAYWFNADLAAIKQKFPQARVLPSDDTQQAVQDEWNAGKIPMLLVHPQSAGHGLSLQHGGHHICLYTQDWNSEYYAQVIERLGPTRQAQSGYRRAVYVHKIIAANTWEALVAKRVAKKITDAEAVKLALSMV